MDLFKNRPLAAVSLVLIVSAAVIYALSVTVKLLLMFSLAAIFVIALIIAARSERFKIKAIFFSRFAILAHLWYEKKLAFQSNLNSAMTQRFLILLLLLLQYIK